MQKCRKQGLRWNIKVPIFISEFKDEFVKNVNYNRKVWIRMDDMLTQQLEALKVVAPYCAKIENAINNVVGELNGNRLEDTDEYIKSIQNGLNWIIEVYNGTRDLINKDSVVIDNETINAAIFKMNSASTAKNDVMLAEAFTEVGSFVKSFREAAEKLTSN